MTGVLEGRYQQGIGAQGHNLLKRRTHRGTQVNHPPFGKCALYFPETDILRVGHGYHPVKGAKLADGSEVHGAEHSRAAERYPHAGGAGGYGGCAVGIQVVTPKQTCGIPGVHNLNKLTVPVGNDAEQRGVGDDIPLRCAGGGGLSAPTRGHGKRDERQQHPRREPVYVSFHFFCKSLIAKSSIVS